MAHNNKKAGVIFGCMSLLVFETRTNDSQNSVYLEYLDLSYSILRVSQIRDTGPTVSVFNKLRVRFLRGSNFIKKILRQLLKYSKKCTNSWPKMISNSCIFYVFSVYILHRLLKEYRIWVWIHAWDAYYWCHSRANKSAFVCQTQSWTNNMVMVMWPWT